MISQEILSLHPDYMYTYTLPRKDKYINRIPLIAGFFVALSCYVCVVPLILVDIFIWQFQNIYFRIFDIPLIQRKKYVILDRYKLGKLTYFQRLNCLYCEYANGVVAYAKWVVNQMEIYSCAIKHVHNPLGQEHQKDFFDRKDFE